MPHRRYTGTGALFFAAQGGHTEIIEQLLAAEVSVNTTSKVGSVVLIFFIIDRFELSSHYISWNYIIIW